MELQKLIDGLKAHKYGAASYESVDEAIRVFEAMRDVDGEKIDNGLECCASGQSCFSDCPYNDHNDMGIGTCTSKLCADAFALIRQQQERIEELEEAQRVMVYQDCVKDVARLITEEDFNKADAWGIIPAWSEDRPELESAEDGWELITCDVFHNVFKRAWTHRPTDEQRKAVKWE